MTCGLSPKLQMNSGKRENSRLFFSRRTPVPRDPRHEDLRRQPAPANLQQEIEMCASTINVSVMRPENAYSLALSRETTEPAVNSRYGGRRIQQPIVPCGRTLSQTVLGWHWRGSQRLSGLASRHQRRLSYALSCCCQRIEHCHVRNQTNEHSFGEPRLHMAVHPGGR